MGLDSVEIVMYLEKTFDIQIPDSEAANIITIGDLNNVIWNYVKDRKIADCKTQHLFYRLRQSMCKVINIPRQSIKPDSILNEIIPINHRRDFWLQIKINTKLNLPDLILSRLYSNLLKIIGLVTILGGVIISLYLRLFLEQTNSVFLIPVIGIFLTVIINYLLNVKRINFKHNNLRELITDISSYNYVPQRKDELVNKEQIETIIANVMADMAGLDISEITMEKRIHRDLGID